MPCGAHPGLALAAVAPRSAPCQSLSDHAARLDRRPTPRQRCLRLDQRRDQREDRTEPENKSATLLFAQPGPVNLAQAILDLLGPRK
jgi:hypothetical protein